jgi:hypothetical protein
VHNDGMICNRSDGTGNHVPYSLVLLSYRYYGLLRSLIYPQLRRTSRALTQCS